MQRRLLFGLLPLLALGIAAAVPAAPPMYRVGNAAPARVLRAELARTALAFDAPSQHNISFAFDFTLQGPAATATGNGNAMSVGGLGGWMVDVEGTMGTATVNFEASIDGTNWVTVQGTRTSSAATATTTTAVGSHWQFTAAGEDQFRARISGAGGGTSLTIKAKGMPNSGVPLSAGGGGGGVVTNAALTDVWDQTNHWLTVSLGSSLSSSTDSVTALIANGGNVALGSTTDAGVGDATGTLIAHSRQQAKVLTDAWDPTNHLLSVNLAGALSSSIDSISTVTADGADSSLGARFDVAAGDTAGSLIAHARYTGKVLGDVWDPTNHVLSVNLAGALSHSIDSTDAWLTLGGTEVAIGQQVMAGSVPVTLASNQSAVPVSSGAGTTGGTSTYNNDSLSNTAVAVDASPGNLYGVIVNANPNASTVWLQFWDVAQGSVTVGTTAHKFALSVPASGDRTFLFPTPITFGAAITVAATTTIAGGTAPGSAIPVTLLFK